MKLHPVWLALVLLVLSTCTSTPPAAPPQAVNDDDSRLVSREEFQGSPWTHLPKVSSWKGLPDGVALTLADGRVVRLTLVTPNVVRWWVPAGPGESPRPNATYPAAGVSVKVEETDGVLTVRSPGLGVKLTLADLSWTLTRGDAVVVRTVGGPRVAGRRLNQAFAAADAPTWVGPGLDRDGSAKAWVGTPHGDGTGPFAVAAVFGVGGAVPVASVLDSNYQAYTRVTAQEVTLGALNGGLDLLVAAAPQATGVVEALTGLLGRPELAPEAATATAILLPPGEPGTFLRKAKLAIQTALSSPASPRRSFLTLESGPEGPVPDLTNPSTASGWLASWAAPPPGTGVTLAPAQDRTDWASRFVDGGRQSPLASMNNRLPTLEAQAVVALGAAKGPDLRPWVLTQSGSLGVIRFALPEVPVSPGDPTALARVLALGISGFGTPAIRLDLSSLSRPETKEQAFQSLLTWMMAPVLTLDVGGDPAGWWSSLSEGDQKRFKAILDRRSQFQPLWSELARRAAGRGLAPWSPVWFAAPSDPKARAQRGEFLVGDSLLVAAADGAGGTQRVYLPGPGVWFDFWTGEEFGSGQSYDIEGKPDRPLVFVRGGALVPVREAQVFDDKDVYNPLTIHVFPGGRGQGSYYRDDGVSASWKAGGAWETRLSYDFSQKDMSFDHAMVATTGQVKADPYLLYRLHNVYRPKQVTIDGKVIPLFGDSWGITDSDRSAAWYESDHTLLIKTFHPEQDQTILIHF